MMRKLGVIWERGKCWNCGDENGGQNFNLNYLSTPIQEVLTKLMIPETYETISLSPFNRKWWTEINSLQTRASPTIYSAGSRWTRNAVVWLHSGMRCTVAWDVYGTRLRTILNNIHIYLKRITADRNYFSLLLCWFWWAIPPRFIRFGTFSRK